MGKGAAAVCGTGSTFVSFLRCGDMLFSVNEEAETSCLVMGIACLGGGPSGRTDELCCN